MPKRSCKRKRSVRQRRTRSFRRAPIGLRTSSLVRRNKMFPFITSPTLVKRSFLPMPGLARNVGNVRPVRPVSGLLGSPIGKPQRPFGLQKGAVKNSNGFLFPLIGNGNGNKLRSASRVSKAPRNNLRRRRKMRSSKRMDMATRSYRRRRVSRKNRRSSCGCGGTFGRKKSRRYKKRSRKRSKKLSRKRSRKRSVKPKRKTKKRSVRSRKSKRKKRSVKPKRKKRSVKRRRK